MHFGIMMRLPVANLEATKSFKEKDWKPEGGRRTAKSRDSLTSVQSWNTIKENKKQMKQYCEAVAQREGVAQRSTRIFRRDDGNQLVNSREKKQYWQNTFPRHPLAGWTSQAGEEEDYRGVLIFSRGMENQEGRSEGTKKDQGKMAE